MDEIKRLDCIKLIMMRVLAIMTVLCFVCALFVIIAVISYIVFCSVFMPSKALSLKKHEKSAEKGSANSDDIRKKYSSIYREVAIPGMKGNSLTGYYYCEEDSYDWIIFLHGYRGQCTNMLKYMEHFREVGNFNLLTVDLGGHGKRDEKYFSLGAVAETDEIMQWVNWIKSNNPQARVVLFGVSLGGATAINTAGRNPTAIDGVITDSAPSSFMEMVKRILHRRCGVFSCLFVPFVALYALIFARLRMKETSAVEQAQKINCPILLIHSKDDHFVPIQMMYDIYAHLAVFEKKCIETTKAEHTHSVDVDSELYWTNVDSFVKDIFS